MSTGYSIVGANAQDEGNNLGFGAYFNFTGAGVTATISGNVVTVDIPGGGGGGGTPSLPFNSIQYNNAGAFGGNANFTWDGTGLTVSNGGVLNSYLTPATLTLNTNNAGTISAKNGAADATLNLDILDLQVNGSSGLLGQVLTSAGPGASPTWSPVPAASGWVDGGTVVYLATPSDDVSIGNNTPVTNRKLSVYNGGTDLGISVVTLASTDNVIETFVTGEANLRWSVNGNGVTLWGAGGASAPDTRLYRTNASTLALDNGAAGSAFFIPGADGVGNVGAANFRWATATANTFQVYPSAGAVNAAATLTNSTLRLGAGGASALDVRVARTGAATLTIDNNAAGAATVVPGADSVGAIGTSSLRWSTATANTVNVFGALGDANPTSTLTSGTLRFGAGGAAAVDTRIYRSGGQTLTFDNGAGGSAVWVFLGSTTMQRTQYQTVTTAASPYAVLGTDNQVFANPGGAQTITLPAAAAAMLGRTITVKRVNNSANVVTVNTSGGNIDGAATRVLAGGTYDSITVTCALVGASYDWYII